jgi:hypothetical protein
VINRRGLAPVVRVAGVAASGGVLPEVSGPGGWPSEGPIEMLLEVRESFILLAFLLPYFLELVSFGV